MAIIIQLRTCVGVISRYTIPAKLMHVIIGALRRSYHNNQNRRRHLIRYIAIRVGNTGRETAQSLR